jgi:hypothetical protein
MQISFVTCSEVGNEEITCGTVFLSGELQKCKVPHKGLRSGGQKSFMDILPSNTSAAAMDSSPECVFILS